MNRYPGDERLTDAKGCHAVRVMVANVLTTVSTAHATFAGRSREAGLRQGPARPHRRHPDQATAHGPAWRLLRPGTTQARARAHGAGRKGLRQLVPWISTPSVPAAIP